jgi:hypothetical protein
MKVLRISKAPEPDRPPAPVLDLFPPRPPARLIGVVRDMCPARGSFPPPEDDDPPSAA